LVTIMSYQILCILSLFFLIVKSQKCGTCGDLKVDCGAEASDLFNGVVKVTYGMNDDGCRTMYVNCTDDQNSGDPTSLAMTTVNDGELTLTSESLVTCNEDGSWFGNGLNSVVCQISRNVGDKKPIESATCKNSENTREKRAIPEASGCTSQWSNWMQSVPCPDYCGACFNSTYTRTCLSTLTCPCTGPSTISKACNQNVCGYPRRSCCGTLKAVSGNGEIVCSTSTEVASMPDPYADTITICPPQGIWGSWIESCNGTCGGYGIGTRRRLCLTAAAGCPCTGESVQTSAACNLLPCLDRAPCATGLTLGAELGLITCAKTFLPSLPITTCPTFGVWEMWGSWSTCSSQCGGCAQTTRTRTCASAKYGCPCDTSSASETQPCNRMACATSTPCCSPLTPFTLSNGDILCYPPGTVVPTATTVAGGTVNPTTTAATTGATTGWTEWAAASCTANCGLCGRAVLRRVCLSGTCAGASLMNSTQSCGGSGLCPAGLNLPSCCLPSVRTIVSNAFACALPSV
jgi:hypothetical protein